MSYHNEFVKHQLGSAIIPQALKHDVYKKLFNEKTCRTELAAKIKQARELSAPLFEAIYNPTTSETLIEIYAKRQSKEIEQRSEWGDFGPGAVVSYLKRIGLKDLFPMRSAEDEAKKNEGYIYTDGPTIKRLVSERWLMRQMRKKSFREVEQIALNYGLVGAGGQRYVSDATFRAMQGRKKRNGDLMQAITAINEDGQEYTLAELSALSVSNPVIRNNELMTRMRGTDEYAKEHNHVACMWTVTCPSKYHPLSHKWAGFTPRQSQKYLSGTWAKFRAWAKREGHNIYGFRVAEPHKDGCPHWHIAVIFENEATKKACTDEMRRFALAEDGDEPGAKKRRFDCVDIDPEKGSMIGYISKYITKNIDGSHIKDIDGREPLHAAARVQAWASVWGIRQFQPFGQPSVTAWRELRRVDSEQIGGLEDCRQAADAGRWCEYMEAQGGHTVLYKDRPVKIHYRDADDPRIKDIKLNDYGEIIASKIQGLSYCGRIVLTRFHSWIVTDKPELHREQLKEDLLFSPWTCVNNCTAIDEENENQHYEDYQKWQATPNAPPI